MLVNTNFIILPAYTVPKDQPKGRTFTLNTSVDSMALVDDIRSPSKKIKPRLLRHIFKPRFSPVTLPLILPFTIFHFLVSLVRRRRSTITVAFAVLVLVGITTLLVGRQLLKTDPPVPGENYVDPHVIAIRETLTQPDTPLAVDFTFNLRLTINGQPQAIPSQYGQSEFGKSIFNTTNANGDIHVQSPEKTTYTMGDFFIHWGSQFNKQCLLNHCSSEAGMVKMTVNEQSNDQFQNYVIQPNDRIVITYQP